MPVFKPNEPVVQKETDVLVESRGDGALPIGRHRFRLVVVDEAGNASAPAFLEVIVQDDQAPTAVLDIRDVEGVRIEPVVGFGSNFILSGARSTDLPAGGSGVAEYRFTLVEA